MTDITFYIPGILAAYTILMVGSFSPGPSVALLVGIATAHGRTPALTATSGIALGSATINVLTMLGVGLVLSNAAWAINVLRLAGAVYLLYLGYSAFRKAMLGPGLTAVKPTSQSIPKHFLTGYLLQVTNPKAISFWIAIASIGAVKGAPVVIVAVFIFGAFLISFACHGAWALALSLDSVRRWYVASRRWIEVTLGCLFTFFAYRLLAAE